MGQHQRCGQGIRKALIEKPNYIPWCLLILLLSLPGAASLTVVGQKGDTITLPCNLSNIDNVDAVLKFGSIIAYGANQDTHFRGRVHKSDKCDIILQNLKITDAGSYTLDVYVNSKPHASYTYDVHVNVNLEGRKDEKLTLVHLPRKAVSIEHLAKAGHTEVWSNKRGALTSRLTEENGFLTIDNFTSSDAGTYRVLNSSGGTLANVTVRESVEESPDKQNSGSCRTGVGPNAALLFLICLFSCFL
ncbi:uncharacterized protein [Garra rufa]|uniref:uncharacterized protein n=1 Tax=Garra rufa TaxID=137080 RepID=UPI003CCEE8B4